ncbi:MAG: transglycosylase domain-containing protein [Paraclostridium sp.]
MSYYDNNENKVRRRKVSSNNSSSRVSSKQNTNTNKIERTATSENIKRETNNRTSNTTRKNRRKQQRKQTRNKRMFGFMKKFLVFIVAISFIGVIASTLLINFSLKGTPEMTYDHLREESMSSKYVSMVDIPVDLRNAVVAIEDERFDKHKGVDFKSLIRSTLHNMVSKSTQGGSTIEMQLSKNLLTNADQNMTRKIKDMYNAKNMNKNMNKREILELYLNNIYLGNSAYGVAKGAEIYFGKDIKELDLGECAMLAGITNNPKLYSTNYKAAKNRRDTILYKMKELNYITKDQYETAKKKETPMNIKK